MSNVNGTARLFFPCRFPIKAMGRARMGFTRLITETVRRHAPELDSSDVQVAESRGGRYQSVTVVVRATSRAQLDAIYRDLSGLPEVLLAL